MSEQQQQPIPVYDAHEPSPASKRVTAIFDEMEGKQLDNLNDASKSLIERIATFLGVLFGLSILSSNFPPSYLKGNTPVKVLLFARSWAICWPSGRRCGPRRCASITATPI